MRVAVIDPLPMYRRGMVAVLSEAGHAVEAIEDPQTWARGDATGVLLLTLAADADWELLRQLNDGVVAIAVVFQGSVEAGVHAVRAGARSVLERDVTAGVLIRTVEATIGGQAVLPASVAVALAAGSVLPEQSGMAPTTQQLTWLYNLASGMTVAELARLSGYSERAMFRLLQSLYRQVGVRTRIEAVLRAQERGWIRVQP